MLLTVGSACSTCEIGALSPMVAATLVALKGWAAWSTGSTAMLGSLADTALDLVASLVTLAGVWVAAQPDDEKHRFGHGKAEALAAMVQVTLISISALGLAAQSIGQYLGGARTAAATEGITVSIAAMVATLLLLGWQRHVIRRTGSLAIAADHVHYQSDLLLNLAVIVALGVQHFVGWAGADPIFGIAIAFWLLWGAWRSGSEAVDQLMDKEWPPEKRMRLIEVASRCPGFVNLHDLRTRSSGAHDFAQFHIWVAPEMTIAAAHVVVEQLERTLEAEFPGAEILVHVDPHGQVDTDNPLVEADQFALLKDG